MGLMTLIPWYYRWGAIVGLVLACMGWAAYEMHERDQDVFDAYKEKVKVAGDVRNAQTLAENKRLQSAKEHADAEHKEKMAVVTSERDAAVGRLSSQSAGRRIVPKPSAGAGGGDKLCLSAAKLDQGIRAALEHLRAGVIGGSAKGAAADTVATTCRDWSADIHRVSP